MVVRKKGSGSDKFLLFFLDFWDFMLNLWINWSKGQEYLSKCCLSWIFHFLSGGPGYVCLILADSILPPPPPQILGIEPRSALPLFISYFETGAHKVGHELGDPSDLAFWLTGITGDFHEAQKDLHLKLPGYPYSFEL